MNKAPHRPKYHRYCHNGWLTEKIVRIKNENSRNIRSGYSQIVFGGR